MSITGVTGSDVGDGTFVIDGDGILWRRFDGTATYEYALGDVASVSPGEVTGGWLRGKTYWVASVVATGRHFEFGFPGEEWAVDVTQFVAAMTASPLHTDGPRASRTASSLLPFTTPLGSARAPLEEPKERPLRAITSATPEPTECRRGELEVGDTNLATLERQPSEPTYCRCLELRGAGGGVNDDQREGIDEAEAAQLAGCHLSQEDVAP